MKKNLWGGRFKSEMHPLLKKFSYSFHVDYELFDAEIEVNQAYAKMLARVKLISSAEMKSILKGLEKVKKVWAAGGVCKFIGEYEDVHTFIQQELEKAIGAAGKKIHTGRSRNDLVVTSTRVYLKKKLYDAQALIQLVQKSLVSLGQKSGDYIIPGFTHLKKAQPVLMAHHLLAYVEMLEEDRERLADAMKRVNVLPLGSAAIGGSALPLDREFLAKELGFTRVSANSMQATSDRGFITEVLSGLSILWMHLSRLSEDFILWNSEAYEFIELDDAFATGSSLMPQKKNPDIFELIRGRAGVIFGYLQTLLVLQKGLPLAYNRDLQEDKPSLFDAIRKTETGLSLLAATLDHVVLNPEAMGNALKDDSIYATDVLEYLVTKGLPFAEAHETVGKAVRYAQDAGKGLGDLEIPEWHQFSKQIKADVVKLFNPKNSVSAKKTSGSTHPALVRKELARWSRLLS